jgi:Flp pilus assembly secretin CpaC
MSGVPILCQIPGIGKLFSTTKDSKSRNELLIFIRPNIIRDSRTLDQANFDMDSRYKIAPDVRAFDAPQPSVLPIKPVEVIEDGKGVVPEKSAPAPRKTSKKVSLGAPDIDYNAAPKAKPVNTWKWFGN